MSQEFCTWFTQEVYSRRTVRSAVWAVIFMPLWIITYHCFSGSVLLSPVTTIQDAIYALILLSTWMYILVLAAVTLAVCIASWKHFTVIPEINTTRLTALWAIIRPDRLAHAAGHSFLGGLFGWCCTSIIGGRYMNLTNKCLNDSEAVCLNEYHLFLVYYGAFVGFLYGVCFFHQYKYWMEFPHIHQPKFFQVKHQIPSVVKHAGYQSMRQLRYYYAIYFFFGGLAKRWILLLLGLDERIALNSIWGLSDFPLLWQTFLLGTFINASWSMGVIFYKINNTESFEFPIETGMEASKMICLQNALSCSGKPLIQYLAFQDLNLLSLYSVARRKQIFTLSQPGGHPHNWNSTVKECLSCVKSLISSLSEFSDKHVQKHVTQIKDNPQITTPTGQTGFFHGSGDTIGQISSVSNVNGSLHGAKEITGMPISSFEKMLTALKKHPVPAFFLTEIPDMHSRKLFAKAQMHIWASDALSALVAASFSEDEYGVVQQWFPEIISSLLTLQEAVDKHFKLTTSIWKKPGKDSNESGLVLLRFSLRQSLKSSIYRITARFKDHLDDVNLSPEQRRRLNFFLENKE